ncbi:MAG: DNA-formamidopyrimidine glycosylase family protein [Pseudomonadota bacterium]
MPELPDIQLYVHALARRLEGQRLRGLRIGSPFVLRTVTPTPEDLVAQRMVSVSHLAKRLIVGFEGGQQLLIHLMVAGRLVLRPAGAKLPRGRGLAALDLDDSTIFLTEVSKKKRASIHIVASAAELAAFDRGGIDPLSSDLAQFRETLTASNHTLKRALTDQRLLSGIGNAYSDEILFAARLSPLQKTRNLDDEEWARLHQAMRRTLEVWTERLARETGEDFPKKVTAFRPEMAVHGKYREPCPICASPVQRIQYAENEANYCARCQTGGRLLSDRVLARLLKSSWPRTIDELE